MPTHKNNYGFYVLFFAAVTLLACFFPPSADDFGWATSRGYEVFQRGFDDYNGRYFGNLTAFALTRVPQVLPLVKGFAMTAVLILTEKHIGNKSPKFRFLAAAMLLIPTPLFMQSFVWTAGFTNYTLSVVVIMLAVLIIREMHGASRGKKALLCVPLVILGLSGQLFMETFTIAAILIAVTVFCYYIKTEKRFDIPCFLYILSCVAGAAVMFSNSVYAKAFAGQNVYQKVSLSGSFSGLIVNALKGLLGDVSLSAMVGCSPAIIAILILCMMMLTHDRAKPAVKRAFLLLLGAAMLAAVAMAVAFAKTRNVEIILPFIGFILLLLLAACAVVIIAYESRERLKKTGIYLLLILVVTLPLCVVNPVGPRCFSAAYVFALMIVKEMLDTVEEMNQKCKKSATRPKVILAVVLMLDIICYSTVYFSNLNRIEYIRSQVESGEKVVEVERQALYFMVYALNVEDKSEKYLRRYCEYYGLPMDTKIIYK